MLDRERLLSKGYAQVGNNVFVRFDDKNNVTYKASFLGNFLMVSATTKKGKLNDALAHQEMARIKKE